ncbi:hypothetical protein GCK72_024731 [Caenorhabditis remanei]|uniref:C2H2-type domain-containing protein n=1 Tax=Caenorhabditis remanei TaxID=31234 RepID=A0A6A5G0V1_CAERE|nr:hypothetical protein GCK72_024731 [Caenorhabditis remanei]KAF1748264.1 hypothetical protein GCK72_024731 [Caenorhabditis remanei]
MSVCVSPLVQATTLMTEIESLTCPQCPKSFSSTKLLQQHQQMFHTDKSILLSLKPTDAPVGMDRAFICETCGKAFRFRSNLAEHRSVHTALKPYVCKFCGKSSRLKGNLTKHILKHHKKEQNEAIAKDDIIVKKAPKTPVKENGSSATITTTAATTNGTTSTISTSATATATVITTPSTGLNGNSHNNNNSMSAINNNLRTIKAEIEDPDYPSVMMKVTPTPVVTKVVASTTTPRSRPQPKESIAMATATPVVIEEKEDEEICMLPKDMSTDFDRAVLISLGLDFAIKKEASSSPDSVNSDNSDDYDRDSPPLPDIQPPIGGEATLALIVAATNASLQRDGGSPDSTDSQKGASPERELSPESSSSSDSCPSPPKMLQCKECGKIIRKKSHLPIHMTMSHGYPPPMVATATVVEECKPKNGTIDVELELRNIATAISELRAAQAAAPRIEDVQALSQIDCRVGKLERSLETALNSIYTLVQLQSGMTSSVNRLREDSAKHFSELKDSVNRAYSPRRMYRRSSFRSGSYSRDRSRSPIGLLERDEVGNSVVHLLDGLELGESKTSLVGDVVDSSLRLGVLSVDSTNLELESIADRLEVWLGRDLWKTDVDGGADGGSQVGWAEGEPSETVVAGEWSLLLDGLDSLDETLQDLSDVSSLLHGDDTEMVLFVAPDEESLLVVVEDSTSLWPVTASVGGLEESGKCLV